MRRLIETYVMSIEGMPQEIETKIEEAKTTAVRNVIKGHERTQDDHMYNDELTVIVREQKSTTTMSQAQSGLEGYELTIDVWENMDREEG